MSKKITVDTCQRLSSAESLLPLDARVVKWQTRTFEGRMPKGMGVQVPPRAPISSKLDRLVLKPMGVRSPKARIFLRHGRILTTR